MMTTDAVRAVRKQQQLARLAAKKTAKSPEEYSAFYAAQPMQVARAAHNEKIAEARREVRAAREAFQMAQASGTGIETAAKAMQSALSRLNSLQAAKQQLYRPGGATVLSGGTE